MEFLQTAPFYFFFGVALLLGAIVCSQLQLNSSMTFLVAMLGVAILLYGTGSQAAGALGGASAEELLQKFKVTTPPSPADPAIPDAPTPVTPLKPGAVSGGWNVAIAGGAAVLTAFFGFAVIYFKDDIRQVFRDDDRYQIIRVEMCDGASALCTKPGHQVTDAEKRILRVMRACSERLGRQPILRH